MLTLVLSFVCLAIAAYFTYSFGEGGHWVLAILAGVVGFLIPAVPINFWIRKRMMAVLGRFQANLMEFQENLRKKINVMQMKNQVGPKFQAQIEKEAADNIRANLKQLDELDEMKIWNVLAKRQADTIRGQMLFQIKDYDAAAPLLKKALVTEPILQAMLIVVYYREGNMQMVEKEFNKGVGRFKFEKGLLIYALYSWILVKEKKMDEAIKVLTEAKDKMDNQMIENNLKAIANNKPNLFNNSALGEEWYALGLETPPPQRIYQQSQFGGGRQSRAAMYR